MFRKPLLVSCVPFALLVVATGLVSGQGPDGKHSLIATGSASVSLRPDGARISFTLNTLRGNVKAARQDNERQAKTVKDGLAALNIKGLSVHVNDTGLALQSTIDRTAEDGTRLSGMVARSQFTVTVREADADKLLEMVKKIMDVCVENGANLAPPATDDPPAAAGGFGGKGGGGGFRAPTTARTLTSPRIEYFSSKADAARQKAIADAAKEALANAQALAAGGKVVPVETTLVSATAGSAIDDGPAPVRVSAVTGLPLRSAVMDNDASSDVIHVRATVRITCVVQP